MSEELKNNNINLYLNDESKMNRVFGKPKPDPSKNYLILQLDEVQKRLIELERENAKLIKTAEEAENEQDSLDEKIRYMRGKLKNFVELRNMEKTVAEKSNDLSVLLNDQNNELLSRLEKVGLFIISEMSLSVVDYFMLMYFDMLTVGNISLLNLVNTGIILAYNRINPYEYVKFYDTLPCFFKKCKNIIDEIQKQKKEIKKTDEANDYITEFIDTM